MNTIFRYTWWIVGILSMYTKNDYTSMLICFAISEIFHLREDLIDNNEVNKEVTIED